MRILYIAGARYPFGWAYGVRVQNFMRLFNYIGAKCFVMTDYISDEKYLIDKNNAKYENSIVHVIGKSGSIIEKIIMPYLYLNNLAEFIDKNKINIVITRSLPGTFEHICKIVKDKKIPLILESCEWYHSSNWTLGKFDPRYWSFLMAWNNYYIKADGVIAISSLLEKHYMNYTDNVVRIPTIMDVKNTPYVSRTILQDKIQLAFAGGLGNGKDSILEVFEALYKMGEKRNRFFLNIYGPNKKQINKQLGKKRYLLSLLSDCYKIHGKIPQEEMKNIYINCDYGIFIRPDRQSSHAGFPTKLAEFMAAGTPVVTNNTGDISLYLRNGENSFITQDSLAESVSQTLLQILSLDETRRNSIREDARRTAELYFDYRNYCEKIKCFIESTNCEKGSIL